MRIQRNQLVIRIILWAILIFIELPKENLWKREGSSKVRYKNVGKN